MMISRENASTRATHLTVRLLLHRRLRFVHLHLLLAVSLLFAASLPFPPPTAPCRAAASPLSTTFTTPSAAAAPAAAAASSARRGHGQGHFPAKHDPQRRQGPSAESGPG